VTILVCPLSRVSEQIRAHRPSRVISLLDPDTGFPETGYGVRHLRVSMHDIVGDAPGWVAPNPAHIETLLGFIAGWDARAPLLVHCYAGISRSTATAFVAACVRNPAVDERVIAEKLRAASVHARPNERMIEIADALLGRNGRMTAAIEDTGRALPWIELQENEPFAIPSDFAGRR
jgi:predicted protein tyrosine phosphatase